MYLDDVIVFSKFFEDHLRHVEEILYVLRGDGLSVKLWKCNFFKESVDYLGHVIRPGKLQVASQNTELSLNAHHHGPTPSFGPSWACVTYTVYSSLTLRGRRPRLTNSCKKGSLWFFRHLRRNNAPHLIS